ncbi:MAG: hypothetical protein ACR2IE_06725 [Candidatus Sumerlaeaceae bacterium]
MAETVFALQKCGTLPEPRQRHGAIVARERLYVIGGQTPSGWTQTVKSAPLLQGYKTGPWRDETSLPEPRGLIANTVQLVGNAIYIVGGLSLKGATGAAETDEKQLTKMNDTIWASIGADGVLSAWKKGPVIPTGRLSCAGTCSDERALVVTGGSAKGGPSADVLISTIAADGTPGEWQLAGKLPTALWYHGCGLAGGRLYVWGGLPTPKRNLVNEKVFSASFSGTTVGTWREEPKQMPSPVYGAGYCYGTNFLVCVSGKYANEYSTNSIWFSTVRDGTVQPWTVLKTDLAAWAGLAVAVDKPTGRTFVTGGIFQNVPKTTAAEAEAHALASMVDQVAAFQIPR